MRTFPERWGFKGSPEGCIGKTIEAAELVEMEYGCTWRTAWAIRFRDGSRAFFVGGRGSGVMNPCISAVEECAIFTPEELGEMSADKKRLAEEIARSGKAQRRARYEHLKKEFGRE